VLQNSQQSSLRKLGEILKRTREDSFRDLGEVLTASSPAASQLNDNIHDNDDTNDNNINVDDDDHIILQNVLKMSLIDNHHRVKENQHQRQCAY